MWASNESAKKAANGTHHLAIRIGNLRFDEDSDETPRVELMVKGRSGVGFDAFGSDIHVGLMPDLVGKRFRYQAIVVAVPTSSRADLGRAGFTVCRVPLIFA